MLLAKFVKLFMLTFFVGFVSLLPIQLQPKQENSRLPASLISKTKTFNLPANKELFSTGETISILLSQKCLSTHGANGFLRDQLSQGLKLKSRDWQTVGIAIEKPIQKRDLQSQIENDPCIFEVNFPPRQID